MWFTKSGPKMFQKVEVVLTKYQDRIYTLIQLQTQLKLGFTLFKVRIIQSWKIKFGLFSALRIVPFV